ncbi:MAG: hypothetical protein ACRD2L_02980, partial [Terriglobia bacterium]
FTQLRAISNWRERELDAALAYHEGSVNAERYSPETGFGGAPTLFCMTVIPGEERLAEALKTRGFTYQQALPRRRGYALGIIKMWTKTFEVDRPPFQE